MSISKPTATLDAATLGQLAEALRNCPDVAFAHLPAVFVAGQQSRPELTLFVWLVPEAWRSLRSALNLVSRVVAETLPGPQYLDVVILNSAPELLEAVERADSLLVVRDPTERRRALQAAEDAHEELTRRPRPWWWPF